MSFCWLELHYSHHNAQNRSFHTHIHTNLPLSLSLPPPQADVHAHVHSLYLDVAAR